MLLSINYLDCSKYNLANQDMPTSYGSAFYQGCQPDRDASVVAILRSAGALILGSFSDGVSFLHSIHSQAKLLLPSSQS